MTFLAMPAAPIAVADPVPQNTTDLGTRTGFGGFLVDGARGRMFVSEPEAGAVAELDSEGRLLRTISGLPGVYGMTTGGDYLYVAAQKACRVHTKHFSGEVGPARTWHVRILAIHRRRHHVQARGLPHALALRLG